MYETYTLFTVIILFAILFAIGLRVNSSLMRKYAEQIKDISLPFCKFVGFRRYGRGFQALCMLKDPKPFTRIDTTLSLTWRENPMYYILSPITKDKDRIFVWGTLRKKPRFNLQIYNRKYLKNIEYDKALERADLNDIGVTVLTDDMSKTNTVLNRISHLLSSSRNNIEFISIDKNEGWIKVRGYIMNDESIRNIFDLLLQFGNIIEDM